MSDRFNIFFPLILVLVAVLSILENSALINGTELEALKNRQLPRSTGLLFAPVKDTVYVLGDSYIEIHLKEQIARQIFRKDTAFEFKISSGNKNIAEGIETPSGLYTVQTKNPLAISKQFDDAELYFWVGFSSNIGFHGLKGNGYYARLGHTASSHGCVRVSREDCERLFKKAKFGTPVIVYNNDPVRVLAFGSDSTFNPNRDLLFRSYSRSFSKMMKRRIKNVYEGKAYLNNYGNIYLDGNTVMRPGGYYLGLAEFAKYKQEIDPTLIKWEIQPKDNLLTNRLIKELIDSTKK